MNLKEYYSGLTSKQRETYAAKAGTTLNYCNSHLMARNPTRVPRKDLMVRLAEATGGAVSFADVLAHFYQTDAA